MVQLTRLNRARIILNSDLIEHIEVTPDTVITLTTGQKLMVLESAEEVVDRVISFRRAIVRSGGCALLEASTPTVLSKETETNEALKVNGG